MEMLLSFNIYNFLERIASHNIKNQRESAQVIKSSILL